MLTMLLSIVDDKQLYDTSGLLSTIRLRSDLQGHLLAALMLRPDEERTLTALAEEVHASLATIHREVQRLVVSGSVSERRSGRNRMLRADTSHPLFRPVREIVEYAYGPEVVLPPLLVRVPGVEDALIFGSWAARRLGEEGPDPADIDVLVVGRPDRAALIEAMTEAQSALRREVNVQTVSSVRWASAADPFLETVRGRPTVHLDLRGAR